jgi:F-type H+-transporting ATPase subunit gamma
MSENGIEISFTNFGKKGRDWSRKAKVPMVSEHIGIIGTTIGFNHASAIGRKLVDQFLIGEYDEVYVIFSEFRTMAKQVPLVEKILPIIPIESEESPVADSGHPYQAEHICEPSPAGLLGELLPMNVFVQLHRAFLETSTSEHAARMMAMENATTACNDMIGSLTLAYNKARQAAITADLMDIVGGAEALKG